MIKNTIGFTLNDLPTLKSDGVSCVVIESEKVMVFPKEFYVTESPGVNVVNGHTGKIENLAVRKYVIMRRPKSFLNYVSHMMRDSSFLNGEDNYIEICSFGNPASERATIHNVASNYNYKISVKFERENDSFKISKKAKLSQRSPFPGWKDMEVGERNFVEYPSSFLTFRNKCYRVARNENISVTVLKSNEVGIACVTLNESRKESSMKRFNNFLDTIAPGDSALLPDEFSGMKDGYIRVLLSNHDSKFSYRGGLIKNETDSTNHLDSTTPHIDSNSHFIMDGRNYGKKPDRWIELKLKHTEWTLEDVRR